MKEQVAKSSIASFIERKKLFFMENVFYRWFVRSTSRLAIASLESERLLVLLHTFMSDEGSVYISVSTAPSPFSGTSVSEACLVRYGCESGRRRCHVLWIVLGRR